jgi:hypothetical protein
MTRLLIVLALTVAAVSACGSDDAPATRTDAVSGGQAATFILDEDELPDGWRHATGEQHLGIPKMCGVTLEPPELSSAETQRFTRGYSGPFVIQYSFVSSSEAAATKRIDEFVAASKTCSTFEAGPDLTIDVSRITDIDPVGEAFAAVRGTNRTEPDNVQDFVVFRTGAVVTVLQSYSPATLADHAVLAEMARTIAAKQS